jgi:hypothetical protein
MKIPNPDPGDDGTSLGVISLDCVRQKDTGTEQRNKRDD